MLDYKSIGKRIRHHRKCRGLTQEQLGLSINTSGAYISNIERAVKKPSLDNLAAIAEPLNITIHDMIPPVYDDLDHIIELNALSSRCSPTDRVRLEASFGEIIRILKQND